MQIYLPDGSISFVTGKVRRGVKTPLNVVKNGMGVELTEVDDIFRKFIKDKFDEEVELGRGKATSLSAHNSGRGPEPESRASIDEDEAIVIRCTQCHARNKVRRSKMALGPKCGKCKSPLPS